LQAARWETANVFQVAFFPAVSQHGVAKARASAIKQDVDLVLEHNKF
jgi:hypothetical protein